MRFIYLTTVILTGVLFSFYSIVLSFNTNSYLPLLSCVLVTIFFFCWAFFLKLNISNSYFLFSSMYMGYALGGVYYSDSKGYFGKFIEFYQMDPVKVNELMTLSLFFALCFYIVFSLFYFSIDFNVNRRVKSFVSYDKFEIYLAHKSPYFIFPGFVFSLVYWIYVSHVSAGGLYNAVIYFQLFPHFIAESGLSIAPYLILYSSVYLLAIRKAILKTKISFSFVFLVMFSVIVILSTGRIAQAIVFIFSLAIFFLMVRPWLYGRVVMLFTSVFFLAIGVHFARILSNYYYLGIPFYEIDSDILRVIVGGGNVSDLQQLVIVLDTFSVDNFLMGSSYFDWIRNTLGKYFGFEPSSVGLIVHSLIIPEGSSSGAPTPGAIGELYANFGLFSLFFSFILALILKYIDCASKTSHSKIAVMIYSVFITHFVFLYAKVDSTMLVNFMWSVLPMFIVIFAFFFIFTIGNLYAHNTSNIRSPKR